MSKLEEKYFGKSILANAMDISEFKIIRNYWLIFRKEGYACPEQLLCLVNDESVAKQICEDIPELCYLSREEYLKEREKRVTSYAIDIVKSKCRIIPNGESKFTKEEKEALNEAFGKKPLEI